MQQWIVAALKELAREAVFEIAQYLIENTVGHKYKRKKKPKKRRRASK